MSKILGLDIETIPQEFDEMSDVQKKKLEGIEENKVNITCATNPFLGKIVCISVGSFNAAGSITTKSYSGDETELLMDFWNMLKKTTNYTYITFNGLNFDVPFIKVRSLINKVKATNLNFLNTKKFSTYPHFDLMPWINSWGFKNNPSLELVCDAFGIATPKDGEVSAANVANAIKQGKLDKVVEYCEKDVVATLEVYKYVTSLN